MAHQTNYTFVMRSRAVPLVLLVLSLAGAFLFSRGLRVIDPVGMLACGAAAGGALASLARARGRQ